MDEIQLRMEMEKVSEEIRDISRILKELSDSIRGTGFSGGGLVNRMVDLENRQTAMGIVQATHGTRLQRLEDDRLKVLGGYRTLAVVSALIATVVSLAWKFFGK